jgi:hypothetical protein
VYKVLEKDIINSSVVTNKEIKMFVRKCDGSKYVFIRKITETTARFRDVQTDQLVVLQMKELENA